LAQRAPAPGQDLFDGFKRFARRFEILLGRARKPAACFDEIGRHAVAALPQHAELELRGRIAKGRRALVPAFGLQHVALDAAPRPVHLSEIELRFDVARTGESKKPEPRGFEIASREGSDTALPFLVPVERCGGTAPNRQRQTQAE
jgi:hypothetical protein